MRKCDRRLDNTGLDLHCHVQSIGTCSCVGSCSRGHDKSAATRGARVSRRSLNVARVNQKCRICRSCVKSSFKTLSQRCLMRGVCHTRMLISTNLRLLFDIVKATGDVAQWEPQQRNTSSGLCLPVGSCEMRFHKKGQHFTSFILFKTALETELVVVTVCSWTSHFSVSTTGRNRKPGEYGWDTMICLHFCGLFKSCSNLVHGISLQKKWSPQALYLKLTIVAFWSLAVQMLDSKAQKALCSCNNLSTFTPPSLLQLMPQTSSFFFFSKTSINL